MVRIYGNPLKVFEIGHGGAHAGRFFIKKWTFLIFWGRIPTPWTDWGEISHSQADPSVRGPRQVQRESIQRVAPAGRKTWFSACE